jgi:hypothetical protein
LVHNAATLVLPGGVNVITAPGDMAVFISDGAGAWRCFLVRPAGGLASLAAVAAGYQPLSSVLTALAAAITGVGRDGLAVPRAVELGGAAWVDRRDIRPHWHGLVLSANRALVGHDHGRAYLCKAGLTTITLPATTDYGVEAGWAVRLKNRSGGALTLAAVGSETVNGSASVTVADGAGVTVALIRNADSSLTFETV